MYLILQADDNGNVTLPDGTQLCDSAGRPIIAAPEQEVLVDVDNMKPVLDSRDRSSLNLVNKRMVSSIKNNNNINLFAALILF